MTLATSVFLMTFVAGIGTAWVLRAFQRRIRPANRNSSPQPQAQRSFVMGSVVPGLGAVALVLGLAVLAPRSWVQTYWLEHRILVVVGITCCGIMAGLLDDWICTRERILILVPLAITCVFLTTAMATGRVALLGWYVELGPLLLLIAFTWLASEVWSRGWLRELDGLTVTCVVMLPLMICILSFRSGIQGW